MSQKSPETFSVRAEEAGARLDQYLAAKMAEVSRARVQQLIAQGLVQVDGKAAKASLRLRGGEDIRVHGPAAVEPLRAMAEDIPLDIVYEDEDLAVIDKRAGMMVHAGAGATEDARNRGTLVNALLHRFGAMSNVGGDLRPGIVHRLDRMTSGLMVVAKNDVAHRRLAEQFSRRQVRKTYIALVHGAVPQERGTIQSAISRDAVRRTRMTTRRREGRAAITHYNVMERLDSRYGKFTLLEVNIETGRTHQIRVHLSSIGHPVVGDTLYGAPRVIPMQEAHWRVSHKAAGAKQQRSSAHATPAVALSLPRNFLHAAAIELTHPSTRKNLNFRRELPSELAEFLRRLRNASL